MSQVLILSATKQRNFVLSEQIKEILDTLNIDSKIISLEDLDLPLYTPSKQAEGIPRATIDLLDELKKSKGYVLCAPEYNGSIPPIVTNFIAWITVSGDKDWRKGFNGKISLIASCNSGAGIKLQTSLRILLTHLGSLVMPRVINVTDSKPFNEKSATTILKSFITYFEKSN